MSGQTGEAFFHSLVRRLAAYGDGADAPTLEYDLDATPCANVVEKWLCSYPSGIQRMFPEDLLLAETMLQLFAIRAAAELERKNYDNALTDSETRLRALVTHGVEAVLRIEFERAISLDLPEDEQLELMYRQGYVSDCNDQAARLFGRAKTEDLIGARLAVVSPQTIPIKPSASAWGFARSGSFLRSRES